MFKIVKSKYLSVGLIFALILFYFPNFIQAEGKAEERNQGNLIGFVYGEDGITPVDGAVVKLKKVSTGESFESSQSDEAGVFKVEGVNEGFYVMGISTGEGNFNVENVIGIKAGETAKVSLALKSQQEEGEEEEEKKKKKGLAAFFTSAVGIAIIVAASAAIVYGAVTLAGPAEEASPYR
ncbi:MAG: hypothetical protein ACOC57_03955 [Acidobacteriota bacterium]